MGRFGLELFLPIERPNATVLALLERGHAERMFPAQDFTATIDWYPEDVEEQLVAAGLFKDRSMTLIFEQVIPALRNGGMTDGQLVTMLEENPRRWLAG